MVKKRLIPKLLVAPRRTSTGNVPVLVTTRAFAAPRLVGDPVSQARIYESQLADELLVLNIARKPLASDAPLLRVIRDLASQTFMPLTVGGGVNSVADFELLLENGADKVAITTAAFQSPGLVRDAARIFGAQCVVVGLDCVPDGRGGLTPAIDRARSPTGEDPVAAARKMADLGAGELLVTDVTRDGGGGGLNLALGRGVADAVDIPVILSGGASLATHFAEGFTEARAEAVASGTFFAFRDQSPMQTRSHIANAGVSIRMIT